MSLVSCKQLIFLPDPLQVGVGSTYEVIDSIGERLGIVMQVFTAGTIRKVHFRTGTVTTGDTIKASIQGVSVQFPDGVIAKSGTVAVADGDDSVWKTVDLGAGTGLAVTQGQWIAIVLEYDSYVAGNMRIVVSNQVARMINNGHYETSDIAAPLTSGSLVVGSSYFIRTYVSDDDFTNVGAASNAAGIMFTATGTTPTHWAHSSNLGVWLKAASPQFPSISLEYSDGTFANNMEFASPFSQTPMTVSSSTNPDEVGNYFQVPYPCRAVGIWISGDLDNDVTLSLLGSDDTILSHCTMDSDNRNLLTAAINYVAFDPAHAATVTLAKDTWYRVIATPGASSVTISYLDFVSAAGLDACALGQNCHWTQATDRDAVTDWAQTTTRRCNIGIIIDQLDDGTAAGGVNMPRTRIGH